MIHTTIYSLSSISRMLRPIEISNIFQYQIIGPLMKVEAETGLKFKIKLRK